jgi:hypothetical protein
MAGTTPGVGAGENPGMATPNTPVGGASPTPPMMTSSREFQTIMAMVKGATTKRADRNYLQQADEALTKVLNEKAQEFQETIAPLQQALVTIQQAEQLTNPLNVSPPAGTINVMPGQQQQQQPQMGGGDVGLGADPAAAGLAGQPATQAMTARRKQATTCPECGAHLRDEVARMGHGHGPDGEVYDADPQYGFESRGDYMDRGKSGLPPHSKRGGARGKGRTPGTGTRRQM